MRIKCDHGYFRFYEEAVGEASDFSSLYGLLLVPVSDYFTFEFLQNAPKYSLQGKAFLGFTAKKTFEGEPWEVFAANEVVYDFNQNMLVDIASVSTKTRLKLAGNYFLADGLLLPGSLTDAGERVKDYSAWISQKRASWLYSEVSLV